jgi:hypothetical protein
MTKRSKKKKKRKLSKRNNRPWRTKLELFLKKENKKPKKRKNERKKKKNASCKWLKSCKKWKRRKLRNRRKNIWNLSNTKNKFENWKPRITSMMCCSMSMSRRFYCRICKGRIRFEIRSRVCIDRIKNKLQIEEKKKQIRILEAVAAKPDFWLDHRKVYWFSN